MPVDQLRLDYRASDFYCNTCRRYFATAQGALSHCRSAQVHVGQWCERCQWLFESRTDRSLRHMNSSRHHVCQDCDDDFESATELNDHVAELHRLVVRHQDRYQASDTVLQVQMGRPPPPPLRQVQQIRRIYQPHSVESFGCYEQFDTRSAMMMHLESGACESHINLEDIDRWAFRGSYSYDYTHSWRSYHRYRCPTCNASFRVVSACCSISKSRAVASVWEGVLPR